MEFAEEFATIDGGSSWILIIDNDHITDLEVDGKKGSVWFWIDVVLPEESPQAGDRKMTLRNPPSRGRLQRNVTRIWTNTTQSIIILIQTKLFPQP